MEKEIFREGDKVFDVRHGWGEVIAVYNDRYVSVKFKKECDIFSCMYRFNGIFGKGDETSMLSFKEYTLQGFTQERPIDYTEYIRKWGKFWNDNPECFTIGILKGYEQGGHKPFHSVDLDFQNFKPLTDEQVKILELES